MALSPPVRLLDTDKLDVLRRLDQFRQWRSLGEKRFCLVCGKIITGPCQLLYLGQDFIRRREFAFLFKRRS